MPSPCYNHFRKYFHPLAMSDNLHKINWPNEKTIKFSSHASPLPHQEIIPLHLEESAIIQHAVRRKVRELEVFKWENCGPPGKMARKQLRASSFSHVKHKNYPPSSFEKDMLYERCTLLLLLVSANYGKNRHRLLLPNDDHIFNWSIIGSFRLYQQTNELADSFMKLVQNISKATRIHSNLELNGVTNVLTKEHIVFLL